MGIQRFRFATDESYNEVSVNETVRIVRMILLYFLDLNFKLSFACLLIEIMTLAYYKKYFSKLMLIMFKIKHYFILCTIFVLCNSILATKLSNTFFNLIKNIE